MTLLAIALQNISRIEAALIGCKDPKSLLKGLGWIISSGSTRATFTNGGIPLVWNQSYTRVAKWIIGTSGLIVGMIHIGGLTQLTISRLSMTSWSPLGGLPPTTHDKWNREFKSYKAFPKFKQTKSMTLVEFQCNYAWEYCHCMLGWAVGMAFMLPWMYYMAQGRNPKDFQKHMAMLGFIGGLHSVIGWWMVKSGLGSVFCC